MEDAMMSPAVPELEMCGCDREVFERVWRRVMPEGMDSPIQTDPSSDEQARTMMVRGQTEPSLMEEQGMRPHRIEEGLSEQDVVCLGQGSTMYTPQLREMMDAEMEDMRTYQALARRAGSGATRQLSAMAADERRHAKRLGTAYFLITGERYQPQTMATARPPMDLMGGLREQFIREQRGAAAYQGAAQETSDPCLRQLYQELAQEEGDHVRMIRNLLEQM